MPPETLADGSPPRTSVLFLTCRSNEKPRSGQSAGAFSPYKDVVANFLYLETFTAATYKQGLEQALGIVATSRKNAAGHRIIL